MSRLALFLLASVGGATVATAAEIVTEWNLPTVTAISSRELTKDGDTEIPIPAPVPPLAAPIADANPELEVDGNGTVDLTAAKPKKLSGELPNPFQSRWVPPRRTRESSIRIEAILLGGRAADNSVCLNGKIYSRGETVDGMTVTSISPEYLGLEIAGARFRLPVSEHGWRIKLPGA